MHELGVMMQVVSRVEGVARENGVTQIRRLVLQIGELSAMIPRYIEACYPAAAAGTLLEEADLEIEVLPGFGRCPDCGCEYRLEAEARVCPGCGSGRYEVLCGTEFLIKEIEAC